MKHYKRNISIELLLIVCLFVLPCFIGETIVQTDKNQSMKHSQWVPPDPDNLYYTESLNINILKDGSTSKVWNLVDHGIGNISFPIDLATPVNSSSIALEDLRVRIGISQHDEYENSYGPITYMPQYTEFMFEDEYESIVSQIYIEFYALVDHVDNQSLVFSLLDDYIVEIETLWEDIMFFKFDESVVGVGGLRIRQRWRAFPSDRDLEDVFEYLLDNCLPTNMGLFKVDENTFLKSKQKNIHLVANWDGHNESGYDSYDQEPDSPGGALWDENEDDRWEFIAGIHEYNSKAINIVENSENTLNFKDIIPFTTNLPSHPKANESILTVELYHGSKLVSAQPNFLGSEKTRSRYTLDMIDDSGEGPYYALPDDSNIIFSDGMEEVPSLLLTTSIDNPIVDIDQNLTITYTVINTGSTTVYDVTLEDDIDDDLPANSTIFTGDSDDADNDIDVQWETISAGQTVTHEAIIGINETGRWTAEPSLNYHTSTYAAINEWSRNPNDYYGGYEVEGQEAVIVCNNTVPILTCDIIIPKTSFVIGEEVFIEMVIKNVGNAIATDIDWYSPIMGINITSATGNIETLEPNDTARINTSYLIDHPSRYGGYFIDSSFGSNFQGGYLDYWYNLHTTWSTSEYTNEIPINIFPSTNQAFGALIVLQKEQTKIEISGIDCLEVTIHVKNSGDVDAYDIQVTDQYPSQNFTILAGSPISTNWDILPAGVEFTYSYIVKFPADIKLDTKVSYLIANYDISYSWNSGYSCEGMFNFDGGTKSSLDNLLSNISLFGFIISSVAAIALGYLLLKEKGKID